MTRDRKVDLQLAGMDKRRPLPVRAIWASHVLEVESDFLVYEPGTCSSVRGNPQGLLIELIEAKESRESVISFCQKWGVLGLCSHGLPASHSPNVCEAALSADTPSGYIRRESIAAVQNFARGLESLLRLGIEISQDRPGLRGDWYTADTCICAPDFAPWDVYPSDYNDLELARDYLGILIQRLIEVCRVRPRFFWNRNSGGWWQIGLDSRGASNNLPALVAIELIVTIGTRDGLAVCSSCQHFYPPKQKPNPDQRNYCPGCGKLARDRDAQRDLRRRRSEARANAESNTRP
jgi:hypothetical protein